MNRKRIRIPTSIRAFFTTSKSQIITTEAKYIAHTKVFQEIDYIVMKHVESVNFHLSAARFE